MFDVWFDGESVEPAVMQQVEIKLQEAFNLPANQASVLVNGKSHRIKRGWHSRIVDRLNAHPCSPRSELVRQFLRLIVSTAAFYAMRLAVN